MPFLYSDFDETGWKLSNELARRTDHQAMRFEGEEEIGPCYLTTLDPRDRFYIIENCNCAVMGVLQAFFNVGILDRSLARLQGK